MSLVELLSPDHAEPRMNPVAWIVEGLSGTDEGDALEAALKNPAFTNQQIADALTSVGYSIDNKQVYAYRKKNRLAQFAAPKEAQDG